MPMHTLARMRDLTERLQFRMENLEKDTDNNNKQRLLALEACLVGSGSETDMLTQTDLFHILPL